MLELWVYPGWPLVRILASGVCSSWDNGGGEGKLLLVAFLAGLVAVDGGGEGKLLLVAFLAGLVWVSVV